MPTIVLTPGQIISGKTIVRMFLLLSKNHHRKKNNRSIDPISRQNLNQNDPLKNVKKDMERRGLLSAFYESINCAPKEFAGCM